MEPRPWVCMRIYDLTMYARIMQQKQTRNQASYDEQELWHSTSAISHGNGVTTARAHMFACSHVHMPAIGMDRRQPRINGSTGFRGKTQDERTRTGDVRRAQQIPEDRQASAPCDVVRGPMPVRKARLATSPQPTASVWLPGPLLPFGARLGLMAAQLGLFSAGETGQAAT